MSKLPRVRSCFTGCSDRALSAPSSVNRWHMTWVECTHILCAVFCFIAVLCCAVLCCAVLCCAVLCCAACSTCRPELAVTIHALELRTHPVLAAVAIRALTQASCYFCPYFLYPNTGLHQDCLLCLYNHNVRRRQAHWQSSGLTGRLQSRHTRLHTARCRRSHWALLCRCSIGMS